MTVRSRREMLARRRSRRHSLARVLFVGIVAAGCDTPLGAPTAPSDVVVPTTIGLIARIEQRNEGELVTLEDGKTVLLPNVAHDLTGPTEDGRLLIVGEGRPANPDGGVWYAAVRAQPSGCFRIAANGEVRGDRLALSEGFSLPLSEAWAESETSFVEDALAGFCLDESGAVVRPD